MRTRRGTQPDYTGCIGTCSISLSLSLSLSVSHSLSLFISFPLYLSLSLFFFPLFIVLSTRQARAAPTPPAWCLHPHQVLPAICHNSSLPETMAALPTETLKRKHTHTHTHTHSDRKPVESLSYLFLGTQGHRNECQATSVAYLLRAWLCCNDSVHSE